MDLAIVQRFLNFFQDFIDLCQLEDWPENKTSDLEIKNAFLISQHVEKCLDRLQKRNILDEFLSTINSSQDEIIFISNCFSDPPKYILKKIINSNVEITQMDVGFKIFLEIFTEKKLENCLSDLMFEAASKETLLKHLSSEIPKEKILKFKSLIFLSEFYSESKVSFQEMLKNQDAVQLLVVSLCNTDSEYHETVNYISELLLDVLISKNNSYKAFWKLLFNVDEIYLLKMCAEHSDLFTYMCEALLDCGKLLRENMSAEYFYIDFTYSELVSIVNRLTQNAHLKAQLIAKIKDNQNDLEFWDNIML